MSYRFIPLIVLFLFSFSFAAGFSKYNVLILSNKPELRFAAKELISYLHLKSGVKYEEKHLNKKILSKNYFILGLTDRELEKKEGFVIQKTGNSILILGKSPVAVIYGVYDFLEKYAGIKFLSKDFTTTTKTKKLQKKYIQNPSFIYREIFIGEGDDPDFSLKLKDNGRYGHRNAIPLKYGNIFVQDVDDLVPEDEYGETNPEYFCGGQLDFTSKEVLDIAIKNMAKKLKSLNSSQTYYLVIEHEDTDSYCENQRSLKRIKEGNAPSTPYIDFVRQIANHFRSNYPNVKFIALAYLWSLKPPQKYEKLPDNMGIFFAPIDMDISKTIEKNKLYLNYLNGWLKITKNLFVWYYITNFNNYFQPLPNLYPISHDLKYFSKKQQIKGVFLEGAYNTFGSDMSDLKLWVFSKLLWNSNQNVEYLIKEFCDGFYGKASHFIVDYLKLLQNSFKKNPAPIKAKMPINVSYLNAEFFLKAERLFNKALESVDDEILKNHIKKAKIGLDAILLLRRAELKQEAKEKGLKWFSSIYLNEILQDFKKIVVKEDISRYSENGDIDNFIELLELKRKIPKKPDVVKNLKKDKDWFEFQEYTLTNCCGTEFEEDPLASDGVAVSLSGDTTVWGISFDLNYIPDGKWTIYFQIRVSLEEDTNLIDNLKLAFRYGVYPLTRPYFGLLQFFKDEKYHTIKVGTFKRENANLWIAPPGNSAVKKIYVDRVFIVRANDN